MSHKISLVIDTEDTYKEDLEKFYIHPAHFHSLKYLHSNCFDGCLIQNTQVADLTALNLTMVLDKLKYGQEVTIIIDQPITVMQEYDAKQIEANAKLAGFEGIEHEPTSYVKQSTGQTLQTLAIKFNRKNKEEVMREQSPEKKEPVKPNPKANEKGKKPAKEEPNQKKDKVPVSRRGGKK